MTVDCRLLRAEEEVIWDEYVLEHPEGTFFHRAAWKQVIEESFSHKAYYGIALRAGKIVGILPLVRVKTRSFRRQSGFNTLLCPWRTSLRRSRESYGVNGYGQKYYGSN